MFCRRVNNFKRMMMQWNNNVLEKKQFCKILTAHYVNFLKL